VVSGFADIPRNDAFANGDKKLGVKDSFMDVEIYQTEMPGVRILVPQVFTDDRGFFMETHHQGKLAEKGIVLDFVQDNHARSKRNVIRGFHYQAGLGAQWRLIRCTVGEVWDVVVNIKLGSPQFGKGFGVNLSAENRKQLLIPPEFAHGYAVLSDTAEVQYKCSAHHRPGVERCLAWNDPDVAVAWPVADPILSVKDRTTGRSLKDYTQTPDFTV
jgi:dTDP-4-dehydrorhamnose 3,5-epimerase